MIRVLNLPNSESSTEGWRIAIDNTAEYPYRVKLYGNELCRSHIGMLIDPNDYIKLTHPNGIDTFAAARLVSFIKDSSTPNVFTPMLRSADVETDMDITFIHFETEIGCVISDVTLTNCKAISYFIDTNELYMSITLVTITEDHTKPAVINILHGYKGGHNLSSNEIRVNHHAVPKTFSGSQAIGGSVLEMSNTTMRVDNIDTKVITLPKFDLGSVLVTE